MTKKEQTIKFFKSSHGEIAYTDTGTGDQPLILVHGLPTAKELWLPVLPHLNKNFRVVTFDLNDYGQSEKSNRPISHKNRADVLDELRRHVGIDKFFLAAHDLGSSVAVDYMGKYSQFVRKLVLMSPPVYPDFVEPVLVKLVRLPWIGEFSVFIMRSLLFKIGIRRGLVNKNRFTPELLEAFSGGFTGKAGRAALLRVLRWGRPHIMFKDYPGIIKNIPVPTLVIQGKKDPYIPISHVHRLEKDIKESKLLIIEKGAHFLPIDTPEQVASAINKFIG
ncbi:MAG: alpha/beta hydrolase [Candidatus Aminicenantes bacterium]|nr:alpha/beta hydrolase [Candidatus Aminicenantes bacterium]